VSHGYDLKSQESSVTYLTQPTLVSNARLTFGGSDRRAAQTLACVEDARS
jgi:hypothetical protein